ncbi:MAG TPA: ABC transporter substrate-binding protein, partial [Candidatus Latescibacteria bacterium]|nr:ABC transporter substrate-binding protein [Candidatus Latescibacterota bacterium]
GLAVPAVNPIPPMMWSYHDGIGGYAYDPARARALLAEAGLADGFDTELWVMTAPRPYMPQPEKIVQAIQSDLEQVGIRAHIVTLDWATYLAKVQDGQHGMCVLGWTGDNGDPDNFLYVLLDKTAAVKPAQNVAFYKSDEFHHVLLEARRSVDVAERTRLYRQAQEIVHRDAPWVPLMHATQTIAFRSDVEGFELHPTGSKWLRSVTFRR